MNDAIGSPSRDGSRRVGVVALARPTFDVPLAERTAAAAWAALGESGLELLGGPDLLFDAENKILWYKMSVGSGGLLGQCFECMRVCPIANQSPQADPIRRFETRMAAETEAGE